MFWIFSFVGFLAWLAAILAILVTKWYWDRHYWTKTLPPGPPSIPVVGSLPFLEGDTGTALTKLARKYGDIYMLDLGLQRCVVLSRHDVIREVLIKHGDKCLNRPNAYLGMHQRGDLGLSTSKGQNYLEHRKIIDGCFHDYFLSEGKIEDILLKELDAMVEKISSSSDQLVDINTFFIGATINVTIAFLIGHRYNYGEKEHDYLIHMGRDMFQVMDKCSLHICIPFLRYVPLLSKNMQKLEKLTLTFSEYIQSMIRKQKMMFNSNENPSCFIEAFLTRIKANAIENDTIFREDNLLWTIFDLLNAGTDTVAGALTWCILYMMNFPEVKKKVQNEIESVIGSERLPQIQDRRHLPYTEAVIHEVMRATAFIPTPFARITSDDMFVRGYFIPHGTSVVTNMNGFLNHPDDWDNPEEFLPQRHLDSDGKFLRRSELIIFSVGKRNCPGEALARHELFLFFVGIMQKFDFKPVGEAVPRLSDVKYGLINIPKDFKAIASRRQ